MKTNSQKLEHLRKSKGWTNEQLAEICGVNKSTIYRWVKNIHPVNEYVASILNKKYNAGLTIQLTKTPRNTTKNVTKSNKTTNVKKQMKFCDKIAKIKAEQKLSSKEFQNRYGVNYQKASNEVTDRGILFTIEDLQTIKKDGYSLDWLFA